MTGIKTTILGMSFIEVLVSVLILSVGLLGIAALHAKALQFHHTAELRSIAMMQANSMIDRMRANYQGVTSGAYNNLALIPDAVNCSTCSAQELASKDMREWNLTNALVLPQGQGSITRNGSIYTITIRWDEYRTGATGLNCSENKNVDLTCLSMDVRL